MPRVLYELMELLMKQVPTVLCGPMALYGKILPVVLYGPMKLPALEKVPGLGNRCHWSREQPKKKSDGRFVWA